MDVREMNNVIQDYCRSVGDCTEHECCLRQLCDECDGDYINNEDVCKTSYEVLMKQEKVNHPVHYQGKNECIDVMIAMFGKEAVKHFCMCNAYKYRFRADAKNGMEDIEKAEWYETKLIELGGVDNDCK